MEKLQRMCVACRASKNKKELIRLVRTENGLTVDKTYKQNGRGAYICNNRECLEKAVKTKALNRAFKTNITAAELEAVREAIENGRGEDL